MLKFNPQSFMHAESLIEQGKVDKTSSWSFTPNDGNLILGDPPQWNLFGLWHLATDPGVSEQSQGFYFFPYGKGGVVHRSALEAAIQKAGQDGHGEIIEAAQKLIALIDAKSTEDSGDSEVSMTMDIKTGSNPPDWVHLLPLGEHYTVKGLFIMNEVDMADVVRHFNSEFVSVDFVIDYDHTTERLHQRPTAPAAGWVSEIEIRGDGIWGKVGWTTKGAELLRNREYRYLSPVFLVDKVTRHVKILKNAALTNSPAIRSLVPVMADSNNSPEERAQIKEDRIMFKKLLMSLGLGEGAGEDAAVDAVEKMKVALKTSQDLVIAQEPMVMCVGDIAGHLDIPEGYTASSLTAQVMVLSQNTERVEALITENADLKAKIVKIEGAEIDTIIADAMESGKLVPAQEDWARELVAKDRGTFDEFIASAVPVKPVDGEKPKKPIPGAKGGKETAESLAIMDQCGVSAETMEKYGPDAQA